MHVSYGKTDSERREGMTARRLRLPHDDGE